jgi:hypothetical protein
MKTRTILFLSILLIIVLSCKKPPSDESVLDNYVSLITDNDTLLVGETATIIATAEGNKLEYSWYASTGELLGSGDTVYYLAGICSIGTNIISCTVTGANRSESKSVTIEVL